MNRRMELARAVQRKAAANLGVIIENVPNQPKTPVSNFRIPVELKKAVQEKARAEGKDLTQIVIEGMQAYLKRKPKA